MGEAHRNVELLVRLGVEVMSRPAAEARRIGANVDDDIEDATAHQGQKLRLARTALVVKSAQRAPRGASMVVLHEGRVDTERSVARSAVRLDEVTPTVRKAVRLDTLEPVQAEVRDPHGSVLA